MFNQLILGYDNSSLVRTPATLTEIDPTILKVLHETECKNIRETISNEVIEEKKLNKSLKFAVIYAGQVCHGKAALVLNDPNQMKLYWKNKNKYMHTPLQTWGKVDIFGLFEEMVAGAYVIGGKGVGTQEKADGCNDFISLVDWTRIEFMPPETTSGIPKIFEHGEQRKTEALRRFVGVTNWKDYDLVFQFRPDVMFRKPVTEWGLDFNKISYAHFEGTINICDPQKLIKYPMKHFFMNGDGKCCVFIVKCVWLNRFPF